MKGIIEKIIIKLFNKRFEKLKKRAYENGCLDGYARCEKHSMEAMRSIRHGGYLEGVKATTEKFRDLEDKAYAEGLRDGKKYLKNS